MAGAVGSGECGTVQWTLGQGETLNLKPYQVKGSGLGLRVES